MDEWVYSQREECERVLHGVEQQRAEAVSHKNTYYYN